MKLAITSAFALSAASAASLAHAETGDDGRTIIVTATGASKEAEARVATTPGGADIVTYDEYADKSLVSIRDTLAFSPGVYLQPRFGQEVRVSIRGSGLSRGFHMRGITLLQDGVPINLADDNGDFQELEPIFFDHLEIYRGANALRFGSGTLGGAINGITPTGKTANGIYLRGDVGSFNMLRGLASAGASIGPGDVWAAASVDTSDGDREHSRRHSVRFHGNIGLDFANNIENRTYASVNHIKQKLPGALAIGNVLGAPKKGNFFGDQARDIDSLRLQNRTRITLDGGQLDIGVFLNVKELFHPIFQVVDQKSTDKGAYARLDLASGPFELTLGGEARFGDVASRRYANADGQRGALTFEADQKARTANIYAELRYRPVENLHLVAGGIYADGYRRQYEVFNIFAGGATGVYGRADFNAFSPKLGVLFEPSETVRFFANYNRSAEFPGFIELAQINSFVPVSKQTAWTFEFGTRGKVGAAAWDIAFYRADIDGELLQFTVAPDIPASTFNADRTRHQGIEAGLTLTVSGWLQLRQVYQYSDFRFRDDAQYGHNRLPVIPKHMYRAELKIGTDALHIAPNLEWVPEGAWADYTNSYKGTDYALFGITAGATVSDGVDLFMDARNLFNKRAVGDISASITATADSTVFYPVERRAIFGGVRARF